MWDPASAGFAAARARRYNARVQPGGRGRDDERRRRPPLAVAFSQDPMRRRTRFERILARSRRPALFTVATLLLVAAACTGAAVSYVDEALHPARRLHGRNAAADAVTFAARHGAALSAATVVGIDGAVLRGWWIVPASSQSSVLLLHGLGDNREALLPLAGLLLDRGHRVLLPDLRGHGSSGGDEVTWGVLESPDVAMWAEWIERRRPDECVFAFGSSLGAGILIQALPRVPLCAAVVEAPFGSFVAREADDLVRWTHLPRSVAGIVAAPVVRTSLAYARARYHLDMEKADALAAVARSRVAMLVIEDGADEVMRRGIAGRLAGANPHVTTTWIAAGAAHAGAWRAHPQEFPGRILAFLDRHR